MRPAEAQYWFGVEEEESDSSCDEVIEMDT
jgi:hypothetical protein